MASGVMYAPSAALSAWEYGGYPHDNSHPEYISYSSSLSHPPHPHYQQAHQVWTPPSRYSTGTYPDSYHGSPYGGSPPPLRHSLANDPAFAHDPNTNPDHWYRQTDTQSRAPFPTHSHSGLDLPHGFVPQVSSIPSTSHHAHSYHEDMTGPSSPLHPVYLIPRSVSSSSSASDSSTSNSPINRAPRSSARSLEYPYEHSDSPFHSIVPIETAYAPPDEAQSRSRNGKLRRKRRSPNASQQANSLAEEAPGAMIPLAEHHANGSSHTLRSSMTVPSPPSLAEPPKDGRARTSSRPTPPDLDPIDELDKSNPYGINVHHRGPYEAVAAILNETTPIDSPLLRAKGIQQQVSAGAPRRPSRHVKSEPNANPMSLNLQPGQILQSSIYQPTQPTHFPHEFSQGTLLPNQPDVRHTRRPVEPITAEYETAAAGSPLRRNQTLPVPSSARGPTEQSYHVSHPVASEAQEYQPPYPADPNVHRPNPPPSLPVDGQNGVLDRPPARRRISSADHDATRHPHYNDMSHGTRPLLQIAPVAPGVPRDEPPTPNIDLRLTRTLYLTNPDGTHGAVDHRPQASHLPSTPEHIHPSTERRSERSPRGHHDSFYGGQPSHATMGGRADSEGRSRGQRSSPSRKATAPDQDTHRRFESPSQTLAAMKGQYFGQAASVSSSSSRTSSSLAPRHVPKRLVMPSPLASTTESAPPTMSSASGPPRPADGRPGHVLRKRATSTDMRPPQRAQTLPSQDVGRGVFSFFRFGKGSKPTVREVRVIEPPKVGMSERGQVRVQTREEPRKLSKRK